MQLSSVQIRDRPISLSYYRSLIENYAFQALNASRGRETVFERNPGARYELPEGEINLYKHEPDLEDLIHPFKPSEEIIIEFRPENMKNDLQLYACGDEEAFQEMDKDLLERLDTLESDYRKQIL
ncbi:MAG: hypothetical protein H8Z69_05560 [Nanohaloarchaea archaeon]|nr:hypothetical protein [Candidatus Nanohaloarchaea archaeon]